MAHEMIDGPDGYWSDELPVSRGQWRTLALLACRALGLPEPASRYDASVAIVQMRMAEQAAGPPPGARAGVLNA